MTDKLTILIADDDATTRTVLSKMLENDGYKVITADRGEKCLFLALEKQIDGFLIDIKMPGLSGIEICKRLRAHERYKVTPIIFITSMDEASNMKEVFEAGATDFLTKPANQIILNTRLRSHLQKVDFYLENERMRKYANRYISTRTQRMVEAYSITGTLPAPERHNVCVMFTDIRGFTSLTHEVELEELFEGLSQHLGMQVETVYEHGGYIDKFGGDGLMAVFDSDNMAVQSCLAALKIIENSRQFMRIAGKHTLSVGIGIHYGQVLIGNIGSAEHLDYSAIGEAANLASRLCQNAEPMHINISADLVEMAKDHDELRFTAPTPLKIKGLADPMPVYQLFRAGESSSQVAGDPA
ncbi:MAG: adenylate/guanylate cyclase domain-containing protein [Gammaproteobacteria bacterium]